MLGSPAAHWNSRQGLTDGSARVRTNAEAWFVIWQAAQIEDTADVALPETRVTEASILPLKVVRITCYEVIEMLRISQVSAFFFIALIIRP